MHLSKIIHSKEKLFQLLHDKERKSNIVAMFVDGPVFCGRKCLHAMSQKPALSHAISSTGNYRLLAYSDVSNRFHLQQLT